MSIDFEPETLFKSDWKTKKAKLRKKYPSLTEQDLKYEEGKGNETIFRLQEKLGKTKGELRDIIGGL